MGAEMIFGGFLNLGAAKDDKIHKRTNKNLGDIIPKAEVFGPFLGEISLQSPTIWINSQPGGFFGCDEIWRKNERQWRTTVQALRKTPETFTKTGFCWLLVFRGVMFTNGRNEMKRKFHITPHIRIPESSKGLKFKPLNHQKQTWGLEIVLVGDLYVTDLLYWNNHMSSDSPGNEALLRFIKASSCWIIPSNFCLGVVALLEGGKKQP